MKKRFNAGDSPVTPNYDFSSDMRGLRRTMVSDTYRDNPYKSGSLKPKVIKPDKPIQPEPGRNKYKQVVGGSLI